MIEFDYKILQCPITKEELLFANKKEVSNYLDEQDSVQFN
jgi:uncharacterized protein YbaR (Trm112 family)